MLATRVITAVLLLAACIAAMFLLPNGWWAAALLVVILGAAWEWSTLAGYGRVGRWVTSLRKIHGCPCCQRCAPFAVTIATSGMSVTSGSPDLDQATDDR